MDAYQKERMLLGAMLSVPRDRLKPLLGLDDECFSTQEHRLVYGRISALYAQGKPIDPTMIAEGVTGLDEMALINLCIALSKEGSPWNAEQYAKDLRVLGKKRKMYKLFRSCAERLETEDMQAIADECREGLRNLSANGNDVTDMRDIASRLLDRTEAAARGEIRAIKSGLPDLDKLLSGGFSDGDLVYIGARPAIGKSAFGMAIATAAARSGKKVLVCSCEMSDVQYAQRIASEISGISSESLKTANMSEQQWSLLGDTLNEMSRMSFRFTFRTKYVEDLYSVCVAEKDGHGLDLLVVDYIQLLDTKHKTDNDTIRLAKISGKLKALAMELQIPVVALAQVKRQEGQQLRMPTLQELKGSGSLEQDGDKIIFLHRVEVQSDPYCRSADALHRFKQAGDQMIAVEVAKHRDGPIGSFCTRFEPRRMRYTCLTRREG